MKEQKLKNIMENITLSENEQEKILKKLQTRKENNIMKKKFIPLALTATFLLGITAFAATHIQWSMGFLQNLNISEKQMNDLQSSKKNLVATPNVSDTNQGITVSVAQCLCDGNTLKMSFYVKGYELEKTIEPNLEYLNILIDGKEVHNYSWEFFNGINWSDKNNIVMMADGSPVKVDEGGRYIPNYRTADGKMEINLTVFSPTTDDKRLTKEDLENKEITVLMQNFGDKKGKWTLEWNLGELSEGKEFTINEKMKNTDVIVKSAIIYPSSAVIYMDFPKTKIQEKSYAENGEIAICTDYKEPPEFVGVKLKDGTIYLDLANGGSTGYENENTNDFASRINFSRIINPKDVKTLIFIEDGNPDIKYEIELN